MNVFMKYYSVQVNVCVRVSCRLNVIKFKKNKLNSAMSKSREPTH